MFYIVFRLLHILHLSTKTTDYPIIRILSAFSKFVNQICVLRVCYVCATVKNSPKFSKILKNSDMKKSPKHKVLRISVIAFGYS